MPQGFWQYLRKETNRLRRKISAIREATIEPYFPLIKGEDSGEDNITLEQDFGTDKSIKDRLDRRPPGTKAEGLEAMSDDIEGKVHAMGETVHSVNSPQLKNRDPETNPKKLNRLRLHHRVLQKPLIPDQRRLDERFNKGNVLTLGTPAFEAPISEFGPDSFAPEVHECYHDTDGTIPAPFKTTSGISQLTVAVSDALPDFQNTENSGANRGDSSGIDETTHEDQATDGWVPYFKDLLGFSDGTHEQENEEDPGAVDATEEVITLSGEVYVGQGEETQKDEAWHSFVSTQDAFDHESAPDSAYGTGWSLQADLSRVVETIAAAPARLDTARMQLEERVSESLPSGYDMRTQLKSSWHDTVDSVKDSMKQHPGESLFLAAAAGAAASLYFSGDAPPEQAVDPAVVDAYKEFLQFQGRMLDERMADKADMIDAIDEFRRVEAGDTIWDSIQNLLQASGEPATDRTVLSYVEPVAAATDGVTDPDTIYAGETILNASPILETTDMPSPQDLETQLRELGRQRSYIESMIQLPADTSEGTVSDNVDMPTWLGYAPEMMGTAAVAVPNAVTPTGLDAYTPEIERITTWTSSKNDSELTAETVTDMEQGTDQWLRSIEPPSTRYDEDVPDELYGAAATAVSAKADRLDRALRLKLSKGYNEDRSEDKAQQEHIADTDDLADTLDVTPRTVESYQDRLRTEQRTSKLARTVRTTSRSEESLEDKVGDSSVEAVEDDGMNDIYTAVTGVDE